MLPLSGKRLIRRKAVATAHSDFERQYPYTKSPRRKTPHRANKEAPMPELGIRAFCYGLILRMNAA